MTTSRSYNSSDGKFGEWRVSTRLCNCPNTDGNKGVCGATVKVRTWESNDGAYEDYQFKCANNHIWWIEGADS